MYVNVNICFLLFCTHRTGRTPLSLSCENGHSDVALLLINKGASFDVTDRVSYYFYIKEFKQCYPFRDLALQ